MVRKLVAAASAATAVVVVYLWRRRHRRPPQLKYGTAGFRADASVLTVAMERVGIVAALRSKETAAVGVMVTASHNPAKDNGCKIVDSTGEMLAPEWEPKAEAIATCSEADLPEVNVTGAVVVIGRDTRSHSAKFARLVERGATRSGATVIDVGVVTTPQLHHCVLAHNQGQPSDWFYGYARAVVSAYEALLEGGHPTKRLVVDCAGGVGAMGVASLRAAGLSLDLVPGNVPGEAPLNDSCGAEFVQKTKKPPLNFEEGDDDIHCSVDGDADRVVFWYWQSSTFRVLDGDKIATLLVDFLHTQLQQTKLKASVGVVQTAYANGASTRYLRDRGVQVLMAKTGVKHLHHAAKALDIGVYFEANGHGTVVFAPEFLQRLENQTDPPSLRLRAVAALANQVVGDALADALLVVAVLHLTQRDLVAWDQAYTDLPSVMLKVAVADRSALVTNNDDSRLVKPLPLQAAIDDFLPEYGDHARAFVRPSGTEDVVRVYAEATSQALAEDLAHHVALAVYDLANGVGSRPSS